MSTSPDFAHYDEFYKTADLADNDVDPIICNEACDIFDEEASVPVTSSSSLMDNMETNTFIPCSYDTVAMVNLYTTASMDQNVTVS